MYHLKRRLRTITHPVTLAQRAWQTVSSHEYLSEAREELDKWLPTAQWEYGVFDGDSRVADE
jgi:hypothetical protein